MSKCIDCPLCDSDTLNEQVIKATKRYCPYYVSREDKYCSNYEFDMDERHFDVREVEVIE